MTFKSFLHRLSLRQSAQQSCAAGVRLRLQYSTWCTFTPTVQVQWTLSGLVRHFLLCASAGLLYCLAGTEGFHAKQATNHIKPIKRRFYPAGIWTLFVLLFDTTIHQVGAQWTLFSLWLALIRFSEPLQQQQTKHAAAAAVVVREENKLSPLSCVIIDRVQYTQASIDNCWELWAAYLLQEPDSWDYFCRWSRGKKRRGSEEN